MPVHDQMLLDKACQFLITFRQNEISLCTSMQVLSKADLAGQKPKRGFSICLHAQGGKGDTLKLCLPELWQCMCLNKCGHPSQSAPTCTERAHLHRECVCTLRVHLKSLRAQGTHALEKHAHPHRACAPSQSMHTFTKHARLHGACVPSQSTRASTGHAHLHGACAPLQSMRTFTEHARLHRACAPSQSVLRAPSCTMRQHSMFCKPWAGPGGCAGAHRRGGLWAPPSAQWWRQLWADACPPPAAAVARACAAGPTPPPPCSGAAARPPGLPPSSMSPLPQATSATSASQPWAGVLQGGLHCGSSVVARCTPGALCATDAPAPQCPPTAPPPPTSPAHSPHPTTPWCMPAGVGSLSAHISPCRWGACCDGC